MRKLAALGFRYVDLGTVEGWAHLAPSEIADEPDRVAERLVRLFDRDGLQPVAFNAGLGTDDPDEQQRRLRGLCRLAQRLGVRVITLPAAQRGTPLDVEIARWRPMVALASEHDVTLAVETHFGQVTEDPQTALALAERIDGLRLTLDPSHFTIQGMALSDFAALLPFVAHVHLRDAGTNGWTEVQMPVGRGAVNFAGILTALKEVGYNGAVSCEYIDTVGALDITDNLRRLKMLLERLLIAELMADAQN